MTIQRKGSDNIFFGYDHAQVTSDKTVKLFKVPAGKKFKVDAPAYNNPTGLVSDDTNYVIVKLINVTQSNKVMASWSTKLTGGDGDLPADSVVAMTKSSTAADLVAAPADVLAIFIDCFGSPTVPAGRIMVNGRFLPKN